MHLFDLSTGNKLRRMRSTSCSVDAFRAEGNRKRVKGTVCPGFNPDKTFPGKNTVHDGERGRVEPNTDGQIGQMGT